MDFPITIGRCPYHGERGCVIIIDEEDGARRVDQGIVNPLIGDPWAATHRKGIEGPNASAARVTFPVGDLRIIDLLCLDLYPASRRKVEYVGGQEGRGRRGR